MFDLKLIAVDLWAWLVPAVFLVIYLINHLLSAKAGPAQQRAAPRRRAAERPLRPPQPEPAGKSLNAEIEQFLKRADGRRMEKARQAEPQRLAPQSPPKSPEPLREQPTDVLPLEHRDFDAVAASVEQHLGGQSFQQRAEHMVDDIAQGDQEREQHRKQVFDHRLGTLYSDDAAAPLAPRDAKSPAAVADATSTAKALAGLLANQENIKQAIMLKEILERPVDRW